MRIIFDRSTLILLAKMELLDLFIDNFDKPIIIPLSVKNECCVKKTFDALIIEKRIDEDKIKVKKVKSNIKLRLDKDFALGDGEAESIALCLEIGGMLASDDKNAINACKVLRIPFTTAIDILIRAYEKGLIDKDNASLKLDKLAVFGRYKNRIINDSREKLNKIK